MNKTYQFESLTKGHVSPIRQTFMEAWTDMYLYVNDLLNKGALSPQLLETAIWIKCGTALPLGFYAARDMAIDLGWKKP